MSCLTLNKFEEHQKCQKCSRGRELTNEEQKEAAKQEEELEKMVASWGNVEELEDQREDLLDLISELELEATPIFICYTLDKLVMILKNIVQNPNEDKYKILKMDNQVFYSNIGRFSTGIKLIKFLGFVSIRLENNKLAYKYDVSTVKGVHPLLLLAYDELRTALAKAKSEKCEDKFDVPESVESEQDRVDCAFCQRKFAKDRIDKHQPICSRLQNKPRRKRWDGDARRVKGTVFEKYTYKNPFFERFELCLSRRDQANMQRIIEGMKLSREEYIER